MPQTLGSNATVFLQQKLSLSVTSSNQTVTSLIQSSMHSARSVGAAVAVLQSLAMAVHSEALYILRSLLAPSVVLHQSLDLDLRPTQLRFDGRSLCELEWLDETTWIHEIARPNTAGHAQASIAISGFVAFRESTLVLPIASVSTGTIL
jgi:hypothetical protein